MNELSSVELEHCKELVKLPGSLFEVSSRFIGAELTSQLMSLYALRQSISSIPLSTADDSVKWAKLKWWSEELSANAAAPERHPVLRALYHSGARQRLDNQLLLHLVSDAVSQIDAYPESDSHVLIERFAGNGETDILLQAALDGVVVDGTLTVDETFMKSISQATGIHSLLTMLLNDYPNKLQLLPLDWLAEFQVRSDDLKRRPPATELVKIIARLADIGVNAYRVGLADDMAGQLLQFPRHLRLRWVLESRSLERVANNTKRHFSKKSAYGLSDVWFAWRFCRKT